MQLTDFPTQTDFSRGIILTNLNKTDDFGTPLYLLSAGFHSDLFTRTLHFLLRSKNCERENASYITTF